MFLIVLYSVSLIMLATSIVLMLRANKTPKLQQNTSIRIKNNKNLVLISLLFISIALSLVSHIFQNQLENSLAMNLLRGAITGAVMVYAVYVLYTSESNEMRRLKLLIICLIGFFFIGPSIALTLSNDHTAKIIGFACILIGCTLLLYAWLSYRNMPTRTKH